jgi:hypothetical protein
MRRLELEVVKALIEQKSFNRDVDTPLLVDVDQFYGIESRSTSREIAILALWMVDHLENRDAELFLGVSCSRIPLRVRPLIVDGNALACDWNSVLPSEECSFLVGNPPYLGSKKMTEEQRSLVATIRGAGMGPGTLDLASAWFFKSADYVSAEAKAALVVTSSIVQGEQVGQFYPNFSRRAGGIQMDFCYPPFEWMPPNRSGPTVHVVVIGFSRRVSEAATGCKKIRAYGGEGADYTLCVSAISPYMRSGDGLDDPDVVVHERSRPADNRARIVTGSKPIDGGYYIFTADEARELVEEDNRAARYLRPFIGGEEFLTGTARFIAYFGDDANLGYRSIPAVKDVIRKVRDYRRGEIASKDGLRAISNAPHILADEPTRWHLTVVPSSPYLIIPEVTSENRRYIPIGWGEPPSIPSNLVKVMLKATLFDFGLLTSAMHMAWIRAIGGRLTGRYRYSIHLLYNNFPLPAAGNLERMAVEEAAKRVLASRKGYPGVSLEAMYDPQVMPRDLASAHSDLDRAVDRCYRKERFGDDDARFVFLLNLYRERTQAEASARGAGGRRVRRGG